MSKSPFFHIFGVLLTLKIKKSAFYGKKLKAGMSKNYFVRVGLSVALTAICLLETDRIYGQSPVFLPDTNTTSGYVVVDSILIEGNRKTRTSLLLRELEFQTGDTLPLAGMAALLERNRLRLMNLRLFTSSEVRTRSGRDDTRTTVVFSLVETWFIYPVPLFDLADRNFNVWWDEFNRSFKRVNYGLDLSHLNVSGSADVLKAKLQFGYNNKFEFSYRLPPLNRRQTLGLQMGAYYSRAHEVAYKTEGNKLFFREDPNEWQLRQIAGFAHLSWRPRLFAVHTFSAEYRYSRVADSIGLQLNPDFFLEKRLYQRHLSLVYKLRIDYRDVQPYPLSGWLLVLDLRKNGILPSDNLRLFRLFAEYDRYFKFFERFSLETAVAGRFSIPRTQPPYFNNQALGYGSNSVRGYEYYVSDGLDFVLLRGSLRFEVFNRTFNLGKVMPFGAFKKFPLKAYLTTNHDLGYSNDPYYTVNNPLANRLLQGYGLGLDLVAYYDKTARFEYTWNRLGEGGFFVRINTGI
jgi:Omp85 superfamily domain/Surface antigen variable number repeat